MGGRFTRSPLLRVLLLSSAIPYGGQAAIEGVMMKGREHAALAIRRRDGRIEVLERIAKARWPRLAATPLIRGVVILVDMFGLGTWALRESAKRYEIDATGAEDEKRRKELAGAEANAAAMTAPIPAPVPVEEKGAGLGQTIMTVVSVVLAIMVFKFIPAIAASGVFALAERLGWFTSSAQAAHSIAVQFLANAVEGLIKFGVFVGYVSAVGRMADIRRVFEYHGAEHIVINAYEDDAANQEMAFIQSHGVAHPRCGTSFIAILILMSVFLYTLLDWVLVEGGAPLSHNVPVMWLRVPLRIVGLLPLAGISYEVIRAAFKYYANPILRPLLRFGMLFQVLTVRRPSDDQVEVSLAAFNRVRFLTEGIPEPQAQVLRETEAAGAYVA